MRFFSNPFLKENKGAVKHPTNFSIVVMADDYPEENRYIWELTL